ncbi:flagellar basal body-associated protein FliL [Vibrio sp. 1-Bac 57]|uniref:flagellar basal body-associated protein FliL n=1 Tax=Psychromonas sp. SA13A TaxID=2686346 RepID=UPI0014095FD1|nr:flagellar basal body-associated protein FliL [Psychromonas sp. SA13A]
MAEGNDASIDGENAAPKSKKKLIIIIVAVVVLLAAGGGGAFFMLSGDDAASDETAAEATTETTEKGANYVPMPRPFVFNVLEGKRDRTVQIKVQLMVNTKSSEAIIRKHIPLLESTLVSVFGSATIEQLRSPAGKSELRQKALEELNAATTMVEQSALIHTVLFTGFVLQ